ncbi:MAG: fibronectin type III domain-containing protein [Nitrospirae bacterium]|nr:fibronectin type III domain-containing protein [Nitrospirota bacterium]
MKKNIILCLLAAVLCVLFGAVSYRSAVAVDTKPRIAFLLFIPQNIEATSLMETMPTLLTSSINRTGNFEIVERRKVDNEIKNKGYQISRLKHEDIFSVGSALGLDFTVYGDVKKDGSMITAAIKVLDIKAQRLCFEQTITVSEGMLNDKLNEVSGMIASRILKCSSPAAAVTAVEKFLEMPGDLNAAEEDKKIRLAWKYKDMQQINGFKVYRAASRYEPYMLVGVAFDLTFLDQNPPLSKSVFYKVTAVYKTGAESESSNISEVKLAIWAPPPIFLSISPDIKSVRLKWRTHPKLLELISLSDAVSGFKIYRKNAGEKEFKEVTSVSSDVTEYTDKGLNDNTSYSYALSSIDSKGAVGDLSAVLNATTLKPPEGIKAESGKLRRVDGRMSGNYIDKKDMSDLTAYWYRIAVYNYDGMETDMSDAVSAATRGKPPVPQGFTAKDREPKKASLKWDAIKSSDDEIMGYIISKSTEENGEYKKIAEINNTEQSYFIDKEPPLKDNTTSYYKIASYNSAGVSSDISSPVSSTTKALPSRPKGLSAKNVEVKQITLMWEPNTEKDIKAYNIFRAMAGDKEFKNIAIVKDKTSYTDTGLKDGAEYSYAIDAVDEDNLSSGQSSPVTAMTKPLPSKPAGLRISAEGGRKVLNWNANPEKDIKQYNIHKKGFLGISRKIAAVQTNSWVIEELKGKSEVFITALDEAGLESEGSELLLIESK